MEFVKFVNYKYKKIHIFEPDDQNYAECKAKIETSKSKNVDIHKAATGKNKGVAYFSNVGTEGSKITSEEGKKVSVECIDMYYEEHPSFIKMDVEGAELDTLKGAERVIKDFSPKLAICLYHKPDDFYEIPFYLKSINPNYNFRIRHHTD